MSTKINQLNRQTQLSQNEQAMHRNLEDLNKLLNEGIIKYYPNTQTKSN